MATGRVPASILHARRRGEGRESDRQSQQRIESAPVRRKKLSGLTLEQKTNLARFLNNKLYLYEGSQSAMARDIGIPQPQLSQFLRPAERSAGAGISVLLRIRERFGVTLDDILGLPPLDEEKQSDIAKLDALLAEVHLLREKLAPKG